MRKRDKIAEQIQRWKSFWQALPDHWELKKMLEGLDGCFKNGLETFFETGEFHSIMDVLNQASLLACDSERAAARLLEQLKTINGLQLDIIKITKEKEKAQAVSQEECEKVQSAYIALSGKKNEEVRELKESIRAWAELVEKNRVRAQLVLEVMTERMIEMASKKEGQ